MRRYLVVDDNRPFAENLAEILRDLGEQVVVASSGREALEHVRAGPFDALVTDMRMPVMGGADVVHQVRSVAPGLPAIVLTAYSGDDDLKMARREGLLAVLGKPVRVERLIELLRVARHDGAVVLLEDDECLADNLTEALRGRGLSTVTATSLWETERFGAVRPFAALVDVRIPGGPDGEGMRRLAERFPGVPMLVITAYPELAPPLPQECFFPKPFQTQVLLEAVERLYAGRPQR